MAVENSLRRLWHYTYHSLNFYRIHIIFFCVTPLIFSAIFYASNGETHIKYIDALYNSVSAMTVCGLATVDLSSLTGWQQTILFIQMCLGSPVAVSWVTVLIRKYFFKTKFKHIVRDAKSRQLAGGPSMWRASTLFRHSRIGKREETRDIVNVESQPKHASRVRPDMIRRVDHAPQLVTPMGWIDHTKSTLVDHELDDLPIKGKESALVDDQPSRPSPAANYGSRRYSRRLSVSRTISIDPSNRERQNGSAIHTNGNVNGNGNGGEGVGNFYRTQTIEFLPQQVTQRYIHDPEATAQEDRRRSMVTPSGSRLQRKSSLGSAHRVHSITNSGLREPPSHERGFGGFPMPHVLLSRLLAKAFPSLGQKLTRTVTIPHVATYVSHNGEPPQGAKPAPYITFDAVVGRNSQFERLTSEQEEELGGVEYRGIKMLLWIVGGYHIGIQLFLFVLTAGYLSTSRWKDVFAPPTQHRFIPPAWFAAFQSVSAYTNTGMSLVDQSMVPFQTAYPVIIFMALTVLAGNTAFPVFLRFTIWVISKCVPENSRTNETLHFLLDHPRRCFLYLFPSHQTWFLFTVLVIMNVTDWVSFLVLDIGTPEIMAVPLGTRMIIGILQATAVRAAGFATISLAALAPAVKVLYVIMMYVSVYPIALAVRSTNVYEERSLGLYHEDEDEDEPSDITGSRVKVWGNYLAFHARKQLSFDMWWLALALWLICIIERGSLNDPNKLAWFNIFAIIFELVSAYGTVGLSLGTPVANYSFSGTFRPLSKLVVCAVMLRGRHRGLPHAIDRAVLLPFEYKDGGEHRSTRKSQGDILEPNSPLTAHPLDPLPPVAEVNTPYPRPPDEKGYPGLGANGSH
ncbi:hypothetical protein BOTBODRAFT_125633 [Botryobasidium botryosum FD-172 SS1]|uniref:Potassium transport protein n=1 Tax=Botryobasidium botryosum (strain FD-172 SS1) TaxID=930990 RepID=A0A067N7G9_BOTB1|nr:hypothetical protein BOTBODRAFT_125633 [Botryobasidium botryosum FD-172 SS1]